MLHLPLLAAENQAAKSATICTAALSWYAYQAGLLFVDAQPMGEDHVREFFKAGLGIAAHQPACTRPVDRYLRHNDPEQTP